jgi:hypothetical protein
VKNIRSKGLLPFQSNAAGMAWKAIDERLQAVIVALMRIAGLGFLVVGFLLLAFPAVSHLGHHPVSGLGLVGLPFAYCLGLSVVNRQLARRTGARTPWKGALVAALVLAVAMALALV